MPLMLMLIPTKVGVGLNSIARGLARALDTHGLRCVVYQPVSFDTHPPQDEYTPADVTPLTLPELQQALSHGQRDAILETIVGHCQHCRQHSDVVIIQGLMETQETPFADRFNAELAKTLGAQIILLTTPRLESPQALLNHLNMALENLELKRRQQVIGCLVNKIGAPLDENGHMRMDLANELTLTSDQLDQTLKQYHQLFHKQNALPLLGAIPWHMTLNAPRVKDIADFLGAAVLFAGEYEARRITRITLCARSVGNMLDALQPGTLIITSGDRTDVMLATCMAALSGIKIAALLLTGHYPVPGNTLKLCEKAIESGLPILSTQRDSFRTVVRLHQLSIPVPPDDIERNEASKTFVAEHIHIEPLLALVDKPSEQRLSPPAFRYLLVEKARQAQKRIVLPEGHEPRTIAAAAICTARGIAHCVLLGREKEIRRVAHHNDIHLPSTGIDIIDPHEVYPHYIDDLVKLREHKGMTPLIATAKLKENAVLLATLMLHRSEVDGLVSGAEHTTADTIRPALQLIKTAPDARLVSSIFFMCLPDQVLIYGDCAVNPTPDAQALADIAIQSAASAQAFGIEPRIAMISYSTGQSGQGLDVDKVRDATQRVKALRPDLLIDGPLQYDAALIESVAKSKAPNSPVAGRATVFIFPDLNTGNTTYKAVQRSADVLSIGPMLQGLNKPVNDLSRGATVDDIVFTIAITAIQAAQTTRIPKKKN